MTFKTATCKMHYRALVVAVAAHLLEDCRASRAQVAGCCGVYIAFVGPALLQRSSRRSCRRQFGEGHTTVHSGRV
jgi:hypothetical protein